MSSAGILSNRHAHATDMRVLGGGLFVSVIYGALLAASPRLGLGLLGGVALLLLALRRPQLVALELLPLSIFVPPLFRFTVIGLPAITPTRALIAAGVVAALVNGRSRPLPRSFCIAAGLFSAYLIGVVALEPSPEKFSRAFSYLYEGVLPIWVVARMVHSRQDLVVVLRRLVYGAVLPALVMIYEFIQKRAVIAEDNIVFFSAPARGGFFRSQGVFPHQIVAGLVLMALLPLVLGLLLRLGERRLHYQYAAIASLLIAALLLTFSRGPWLGLVAALIVMTLTLRVKHAGLLLVVGATVLAIILVSPVGGTVIDATRAIADPQRYRQLGGNEVTYRTNLWKASMKYMGDHPKGTSLGGSELTLPGQIGASRIELANSIDNAYLGVLLETGWLGGALFGWLLLLILGFAFRTARRLSRDLELRPVAAGLLASLVGFALASATAASWAVWSQPSLLFSILAGCVFALRIQISDIDMAHVPAGWASSRASIGPKSAKT